MTGFDGAAILHKGLHAPIPGAHGVGVGDVVTPDELRARQRAIAPEHVRLSRSVQGAI